jgi:hypothetical protein
MTLKPRIAPNCIPTEVFYQMGTPGSGGSITFGTDCQVFYLAFALPDSGRSVRLETLPGQGFPDPRGDGEGAFSLSIDGEPPTLLTVKGGKIFNQAGTASFADDRLVDFDAPLREFGARLTISPGERLKTLTISDDPFVDCVNAHAAEGAASGALLGLLSGGVGDAVVHGALGGAAGFAPGLFACNPFA